MGYCNTHNQETPCNDCRVERIERTVKKRKEAGLCGSVGGGLDFVCEMTHGHVGKCRTFSKQDGKIIAEWDLPYNEPSSLTDGGTSEPSGGAEVHSGELYEFEDCPHQRLYKQGDGIYRCYGCQNIIQLSQNGRVSGD